MSETVLVPGARRVEATLDTPDGDADACVVACPPHPQMRGHRGDARLTAVSDSLTERGSDSTGGVARADPGSTDGVACLRFDYGEWDEGYGEREDARNALRWAAERYDSVALYGFSFGGAIAALAAASTDVDLAAVALLAPASRLADDLDAVAALDDVSCPALVVYGERDTTADWEPLVERARTLGLSVTALSADHFFVGRHDDVASEIGGFLLEHLQ
ncbi:CocE/NonD family hydrolase [Halocalculus aciditolerans]|uniref:Alpha/beta hydrolase n=1 Tax=Halocalculus aciditolerans TaxID=1383812 RepID=A0A830FGZ4_9EURY|nr:CocE/NonD family hydrolase [Halocalculus aciditolerans]GGL51756.1 alpha/beta hydrolase [Halocalculus aciditolerans]